MRCTEPETITLPIPFVGGGGATLLLPREMTEQNFNLLKTMLINMLDGMKPAITTVPANAPGDQPSSR
ncbi:MAG: hypothetical protein ACJ8C4_00570 [Gemmataceae bacterium]